MREIRVGICPVCEGEVPLDHPRRGKSVVCPECEAFLWVVNVHPLILEELEEEEEEIESSPPPNKESEEDDEDEEDEGISVSTYR